MTRGIARGAPAWAGHWMHVWEEQAGNTTLTLWLRVTCLALGQHAANGHASFKPGALVEALSSVDRTTGEVTGPSRQHVSRAIRTAVAYGFLAPESSLRCLVVRPRFLRSGPPQRSRACAIHDVDP